MFCQRCGAEVPDGTSFCGSCGHDLGATTPLAAIREVSQQTEIDVVRTALKADYAIEKELGRGGMAIVYKAREIMLDREVAIKVLPFSLAFDQEFVERFQREARTAARLEHPNIIPVYRVGKSENVIYFSMKFLRGQSLAELIEDKGKLPPARIRQLLIEAASALGYAHKHDIVHRDIKPDNIMFREGGQAVVCDFGIAKAASGTRLTGTGMAIGTPYYMSPEQARAQPLDGRSDLYSLGVVAYQCLTGSVPFDGDDSFAIGYKHIMEELPSPQLNTGEERALFEVIRKMMAKEPADRFQKAEDLVLILSDGGPTAQAIPIFSSPPAHTAPRGGAPTEAVVGLDETPTGAAPIPTGAQPTPTTPMPRESMETGARARRKKSRAPALIGALVVLLGGAGGAYYVTQVVGGGDRPEPTGSTDGNPGGQTGQVALGTTGTDSSRRTEVGGERVDSVATRADTATRTDLDEPPGPAPAPTTGTLVLNNVPSGATVLINDLVMAGNIPPLQPGRYNVEVTRSGYEPFRTAVDIVAGEEVVRTVRLQARAAPPPPVRNVTQCAEWNDTTYNADGSCFSQAPRMLDAPLVPRDNTVPDKPARPVTLIVEVRPDGTAGQVTVKDPSDQPLFAVLALAFARQARYQPAMRGGQPATAFFQFLFYAQ